MSGGKEAAKAGLRLRWPQQAFDGTIRKFRSETAEVCSIFCATANSVEVIVAQGGARKGRAGGIDGFSHKGVETPADVASRQELPGQFGYQL